MKHFKAPDIKKNQAKHRIETLKGLIIFHKNNPVQGSEKSIERMEKEIESYSNDYPEYLI